MIEITLATDPSPACTLPIASGESSRNNLQENILEFALKNGNLAYLHLEDFIALSKTNRRFYLIVATHPFYVNILKEIEHPTAHAISYVCQNLTLFSLPKKQNCFASLCCCWNTGTKIQNTGNDTPSALVSRLIAKHDNATLLYTAKALCLPDHGMQSKCELLIAKSLLRHALTSNYHIKAGWIAKQFRTQAVKQMIQRNHSKDFDQLNLMIKLATKLAYRNELEFIREWMIFGDSLPTTNPMKQELELRACELAIIADEVEFRITGSTEDFDLIQIFTDLQGIIDSTHSNQVKTSAQLLMLRLQNEYLTTKSNEEALKICNAILERDLSFKDMVQATLHKIDLIMHTEDLETLKTHVLRNYS